MGYSFGGATALRTAIQHPALVRRLVIVSGPARRDGWYPESLAGMDQMGSQLAGMLMQSPVGEAYARIAPRPEDFGVLLDKTGELLRRDYDWSADIAKITAQAMLVYADADAVRPAHIVDFYALLGGGLRDANWTVRPGPWRGWPSCRATRTTTSSARPGWPARSSRSSTRHRSTRPRRSASEGHDPSSPPGGRVVRRPRSSRPHRSASKPPSRAGSRHRQAGGSYGDSVHSGGGP